MKAIMKPPISVRIAAFLTRKEIVVLKSHDKRIYFTLAVNDPFGEKRCHVFPFTRIGNCILHDDGSTSGESSYIEKWTKYSKN